MDEKSLAIVDNKIIQSRHSMSMPEIRLFMFMIFAYDKTRKEIRVPAKDVAKLIGLNHEKYHHNLKKVTQKLQKRLITLEQTNGDWESYNVTSKASVVRGEFVLMPSSAIEPFIVKLDTNFTKLSLIYAYIIKNDFAFRLWTIAVRNLRMERDFIKISLEELREALEMPESKYKDWRNFRKFLIDPAVEQVNEKTELNIEWKPIKAGVGAAVVALEFNFSWKQEKPKIFKDFPFFEFEYKYTPQKKGKKEAQEKINQNIEIIKKYVEAGVKEKVAEEWFGCYGEEKMNQAMTALLENKKDVSSKGGFLRNALEKGWGTREEPKKESRMNLKKLEKDYLEWRFQEIRDAKNELNAEDRQKWEKFIKNKGENIEKEYMTKGFESSVAAGVFMSFFMEELEIDIRLSFTDFLKMKSITLSENELAEIGY